MKWYISKYGDKEGPLKYRKYCISKGHSLAGYICRHGEEKGKEKFEEYWKNTNFSTSKEAFIRRHGKEGVEKYDAFRKKQGDNNRIDSFIERYGEIEGKKKYLKKTKSQAYKVSAKYYKDLGCSNKEIKNIMRKIKDHGSFEYFTKIYGKEIGALKYAERCSKCGITLDRMVEKYGKEKGTEKYYSWIKKVTDFRNPGFSKISQKLFWKLCENLSDCVNIDDVQFMEKNKKEYRMIQEKKKCYFLDFVIKKPVKICIEYNGDAFHANPKMFVESDTPHPFDCDITSKEIWQKDSEKAEYVKSKGFEFFVVWDSDFKENEVKVIDELSKKIREIIFEKNQQNR